MTADRDRPWLRFYGAVSPTLDYPRTTLYEAVLASARRTPDAVAWDFFATTATYRALAASIDRAAASISSIASSMAPMREVIAPRSKGVRNVFRTAVSTSRMMSSARCSWSCIVCSSSLGEAPSEASCWSASAKAGAA